MLHVTNGDVAADLIRAAGLPGEVLPWRDVLHEGPVPARLPLAELSHVRARFIAQRGWAPEAVAADFRERDDALSRARDHDELVLWFEHDLYDQLQLLQVLDWLADEDPGPARATLVCGAEYLGHSTADRLAERFSGRAEITDAQLALAEDAWNAFRSPDPTAIEALLARDTSALPFVGPALRRHLEQFPSARNGLSRSEQAALEAIDGGAATIGEAFVASHHRREEPVWLGDSTFVSYLHDLSRAGTPLVTFDDGQPIDLSDGTTSIETVRDRRLVLTDAGKAVMEGREDRVRLNGIDRWLGGVHLCGREIEWRWDGDAGRLARGSSV